MLLLSIMILPVIYSVHPRTSKVIKERGIVFHPNVRSMKPFSFSDYNNLQRKAFCVVSDSGTIAEEASCLKFPAVSIRTSTERPEALDKGNFTIGGITAPEVVQAIDIAVAAYQDRTAGINVPDYVDANVSMKVVNIIQSYTHIVNKMVWRKY